MKLFHVTILALFALTTGAAVKTSLPITTRLSAAAKNDIQNRIAAAGGCNANICFAIDGSGSISDTEFTNEKNFVLDVSSLISVDYPVEMAAVQYATSNTAITPLTPLPTVFNQKVSDTQQMGGNSFLAGGINYCFSQLFRRRGEANKIVVLGDARSNIGADAVSRANLFRRAKLGEISVVGAGFPDDTKLLAIAGGKQENVFEVSSFFDTLELQAIIEELTVEICKA